MNHRTTLAWAGILGATGVGLGAFGAHALRDSLAAAGTRPIWETAVEFHLVHAAALAGLAGWMGSAGTGRCAAWAVRLLCAGVILFSGSLYGYALGGPHWLVFATPLGGLSLIAGWVLMALAAFAG